MIFTFYSYKGGVGRSMAMANVADALARRGLKVCMVDFDLEAPGLEAYFPVDPMAVRSQDGLLDLLLAYKRAMSGTGPEDGFTQLDHFLFSVYRRLPGGGALDLLPAGRRADAAGLSRYATELQRFDWQDFFFNWAGSRFFEWLRLQLGRRYDVVLVDSRTGVTEMGGVCAYQLADSIVALCAPNRQNVDGTARAIADFTSARVLAQRGDRALSIVVVPSRVERRAEAQLAQFKARFETAFRGFEPEGTAFWDLLIPYEPAWAFDESTAGRIDPKRGGASVYTPLIDLMVRLGDFELAAEVTAPVRSAEPQAALASAARNRISFNPTQSVAPADLMLFYPAARSAQTMALEVALRAEAIRVQRVAAPPGADRAWARTMQWATRFAAQVVIYEPEALGGVVETLRGQAEAPVALVPGGDDLVEALYTALARGASAPASVTALADLLRTPDDEDSTTEEAPVHNPYVGERAFDEGEAGWFFGREADIEALVARLVAEPVVTLSGPSGAGKSSLLRAGLMPALRAGGLGAGWEITLVKAQPGLEVAEVLAAARKGAPSGGLVFVVDDAEVLSPKARRQLVDAAGPQLRVLLATRADRVDAEAGSIYALAPLRRDEMRQAMVGAADRAGVGLEEGLLDRILDDLEFVATPLSALQAIMRALFKSRRAGWLTHAAYDRTGYPSGQVTVDRADATLLSLDEAGQRGARGMFLRLVTADGELRTVTRDELPDDAPIDAYLRARVLWAGRRYARAVYRLTDGRLPERWRRLAQWLEEDAAFVRWLDFVQTARQAGDDVLMTWGELGKAEAFAKTYSLAPAEREFVARAQRIEAERAANERAREARGRRVAVAVLAVMLTLAAFLIVQFLRADRATDARRRSDQLSSLQTALNTAEDEAELDRLYNEAKAVAKAAGAANAPVEQYKARVLAADVLVKKGEPNRAEQLLKEAEASYKKTVARQGGSGAGAAVSQHVDVLRSDLEGIAGLDWPDLREADFLLLVQLDTTCAWTREPSWGEACHSFKFGKQVWARWRPDWEGLFNIIEGANGRVVFVVPDDAPVLDLGLQAEMGGQPLEKWRFFGGVIRERDLEKAWDVTDKMRSILVVSPGPAAVWPSANVFVLEALDYGDLCGGVQAKHVKTGMARLQASVSSAHSGRRKDQSFVQAFFRFSEGGKRVISNLMKTRGISRGAAEALLLSNEITQTQRRAPRKYKSQKTPYKHPRRVPR